MVIRSYLFFICFNYFLFLGSTSHASTYPVESDVIGNVDHYVVKKEDNLYAIARRFDLGIVELLVANPGVDPWIPKPGTILSLTTSHILPEQRQGIVLNLSELRLFYFSDDHTVMTFPVGIGRDGWQTPTGVTTITNKRSNPSWIPPQSIRDENPDLPEIVPPGPDNPMGQYALSLGWNRFAIHGTNRPNGIGKRSSHGCIRLYPEDIEILFKAVKVGTPITIIDTPYKLGWENGTLYLQVTPTQTQGDKIAEYRKPHSANNSPTIYAAVKQLEGDTDISWPQVEEAIARHNGIPVAIGKRNAQALYHPQ
ncbi:MAG: L,D-transpeptidase family protein [Alphaproteobacteria bacterium]|nr:L,D-transpeptidase family protein [Alphaproteobacteria bacterium]